MICIYALFENLPTVQTRRQIFMHGGSTDPDLWNDVPFGICLHGSRLRGKHW